MAKLVVANWKMNPGMEAKAIALAKASARAAARAKNANVVLCPPFVYLRAIEKVLPPKSYHLSPLLGAQDCFYEDAGAHTGEISPAMLAGIGAEYVIIGHSERRALGETDGEIAKKVRAAIRAGLTPILCVGEPLSVRAKGLAAAKKFVAGQLRRGLSSAYHLSPKSYHLVVAYEPIWSISTSGTGKVDTPEAASQMIGFLRGIFNAQFTIFKNAKIIYGGSVNPKNARAFLSRKEIDGALVGGASLDADTFGKIIAAV